MDCHPPPLLPAPLCSLLIFLPLSLLCVPSPPLPLPLLCLANEKEKESMGMPLCASRGVEWKSIRYLKRREPRNNTAETQMNSPFNIGDRDETGSRGKRWMKKKKNPVKHEFKWRVKRTERIKPDGGLVAIYSNVKTQQKKNITCRLVWCHQSVWKTQ